MTGFNGRSRPRAAPAVPAADQSIQKAAPAAPAAPEPPPERTFPIQGRLGRRIKFVAWSLAERLRKPIEERHGASLEQIARLGGLSAHEFACALDPERFRPGRRSNADDAEEAISRAARDNE